MEFIGRKTEIDALQKIYLSNNYEGVLVYGRRRIGKSELIKESYKNMDCKVIYYECLKVSEKSNTTCFSEVIAKVFGIPKPSFDTFTQALDFLFKASLKEKIIVVLDEYPYLREKIAGCDSLFQSVIDQYAMNCNMKFILCGSYIDVMESLIEESNPLHKRFSLHLNIKQMDYYDSSLFYPNLSNEDKVKIYSVFGGLPYYNRLIDDKKTVKDNIIDLILSSGARLERDPEISLETEISKMANANETFLAIAKGKSKFSDILSSSQVSSSPTLADILKKLISMDVIRKEMPINDEGEKKSYYSINDRLSLFYYRYIYPRRSFLTTMNESDFYDEFIHEDFESFYVPKEFEEITKQYLIRKNKQGEIKPTLYKVGKFYYDDPINKRNGEFDVVTLNKNGYDFYEVKFTKKAIDDSIVNEELYQLSTINIKYNRLGFVSKSGFSITDKNKYILIDIDMMYQ